MIHEYKRCCSNVHSFSVSDEVGTASGQVLWKVMATSGQVLWKIMATSGQVFWKLMAASGQACRCCGDVFRPCLLVSAVVLAEA